MQSSGITDVHCYHRVTITLRSRLWKGSNHENGTFEAAGGSINPAPVHPWRGSARYRHRPWGARQRRSATPRRHAQTGHGRWQHHGLACPDAAGGLGVLESGLHADEWLGRDQRKDGSGAGTAGELGSQARRGGGAGGCGRGECRLKVRSGLTFHNGKTLDADDVVYSLNLHRGPETRSAVKSNLADVTDVRKSGAMQVTVTLKSGDADLPYLLSDYHLLVVPDGFQDWAKPIGTGPFVF